MDTRQYGPALFPTLKQVRRMLDEGTTTDQGRQDEAGEESRGGGSPTR